MKILLQLLFILFFFSIMIGIPAISDRSHISKFMENQGYSDVQIGKYSFFGCGRDDFYRNEFTAINPVGNKVNGYICEGIFKGKTIRID